MTTKPVPRAAKSPIESEDIRSGLSPASIVRAFQDNLGYLLARFPAVATANDNYLALAYSVRDRLLQRWLNTARTYFERRSRTVCYLSAEFLMGPQLGNNLVNLEIYAQVRDAVQQIGLDRSIREYCERIWKIAVPIKPEDKTSR